MVIGNYIFWISSIALCAVFIIWCIGFFTRAKSVGVPIAYAGSLHGHHVSDKRIPSDIISKLTENVQVRLKPGVKLQPYAVSGDSMQFANIVSGDIVFANYSELENISFPKIVVLSDPENGRKASNFKLRRAWGEISSNATSGVFEGKLNEILHSEDFMALRQQVGQKCPSDSDMKLLAIDKFNGFSKDERVCDFLISTTYRRSTDKIEFSLHPKNRLKGLVEAVCSPRDGF